MGESHAEEILCEPGLQRMWQLLPAFPAEGKEQEKTGESGEEIVAG